MIHVNLANPTQWQVVTGFDKSEILDVILNKSEITPQTLSRNENIMKVLKILFVVSIVFSFVLSAAIAGDFDWTKEFNIKAEADPSGFRARLAARFKIGDAEVKAVISNVEKPADAYIVLRLGEMSDQPTEKVIEKYHSGKGKGWGVIAKSLGIKPGSKEFHALKHNHDLHDGKPNVQNKGKGKDKSKGKGKQ